VSSTRVFLLVSPLWLLTALAHGSSAVVLGLLPWWGALGLLLHLALGAALEVGRRRDVRGRRRLVFAGVAGLLAIALAGGAAELVLRAREQRLPRGVLVRLGGAPFAFCDATSTVHHDPGQPWVFRGALGAVVPAEPAEPELVRSGALRQHPLAEPVEEVGLAFDSNGLRNPPERAAGRCEVVTVGDSFTVGWNLPLDDGWPRLLEGATKAPVYNVAFNAWGPSQELGALRAFGLPRRPRLVVWALFDGNDVFDERLYREHGGRSEAAPAEVLRGSRLLALLGWGASRLPSWLVAAPGGPQEAPVVTIGGKAQALGFTAGYLEELARPREAWLPDPGVRGLVEVLLAAKDDCAAAGARLVVLRIPSKERLVYPLLSPADRRLALRATLARGLDEAMTRLPAGMTADAWRAQVEADLDGQLLAQAQALPRLLLEVLAGRGVEVVDLEPALRARYLAGEPPYFALDSHWNRVGQRVGAEAAAAALATTPSR
jgi:hypothetical protein